MFRFDLKKINFRCLGLATIAICASASILVTGVATANTQVIAGHAEYAWFDNNSIPIRARLDTGAKNSSINAQNYKIFKKDGADWVTFSISNREGKTLQIERPVVRIARIRRSGVGVSERPVVMLTICIAGKVGEVEFNLADRKKMSYQVLIGRSFLAERILVDSGKTYTAANGCSTK